MTGDNPIDSRILLAPNPFGDRKCNRCHATNLRMVRMGNIFLCEQCVESLHFVMFEGKR